MGSGASRWTARRGVPHRMVRHGALPCLCGAVSRARSCGVCLVLNHASPVSRADRAAWSTALTCGCDVSRRTARRGVSRRTARRGASRWRCVPARWHARRNVWRCLRVATSCAGSRGLAPCAGSHDPASRAGSRRDVHGGSRTATSHARSRIATPMADRTITTPVANRASPPTTNRTAATRICPTSHARSTRPRAPGPRPPAPGPRPPAPGKASSNPNRSLGQPRNRNPRGVARKPAPVNASRNGDECTDSPSARSTDIAPSAPDRTDPASACPAAVSASGSSR
jgi:hypothetical protein